MLYLYLDTIRQLPTHCRTRQYVTASCPTVNMDANKRSFGDIFDGSIRLVVPLFQRPYVWEQVKNWQPLWESIRAVAERRLAGGMQRPHFLGAVVLARLKTPTADIDARQVIDGQQRITTFQVALAAARDLCWSLGEKGYFEAFRKLTRNDTPLSNDPDHKFKVWPTNEDRSTYRNVMTAESCEEVCKRFNGKANAKHVGANNRIANAYLFFYRMFAGWLGPKESVIFGERLSALWPTMKDDMQVVVIDLDDKEEAQVIFQTLNALGTPLLQADLVKNFLLKPADVGDEKNIEDAYQRYWKSFDNNFWREDVGQGRLKRPRIDQFLQHYLTLVKQDDAPATTLFDAFHDYAINNQTISAADHLRTLHTYGGVFEKFQSYDKSSREGQFFYRLEELETTTFFPLLLEVFKSADQQPPEEIARVLEALESFMIRRMVCGLTTKGYNKLVRSLIQKLRGSERFSADAIRDFLLSEDAESTRWPTDEEFQEAWRSRPVYKLLTRGRIRIVLEALGLALHTEKSEEIVIKSMLTIEHVMPQEWKTDQWPLPRGLLPDDATQRRNERIHTFGNLTLVTGKLNPSMSNSSWETKKKALSKHATLALNRELCILDAWDDAAIEHRAGELFNLAKKIWPRPVSPANPISARKIRSLDNVKLKWLSDVIEASDPFNTLDPRERKECSRMLGKAVDLLWKRTWAWLKPVNGKRAQSEFTGFINCHRRLLECVKHIFEQNSRDSGRAISILKLSPGQCSALMYLMASCSSDGDGYRNAEPPSEKQLVWEDWEKAEAFWVLLASGDNELSAVREALGYHVGQEGDRVDEDTGNDLSQSEKLAILIKAWRHFLPGGKLTDKVLNLEYRVGENGIRCLAECPTVGGIDRGDPQDAD